jgi:hypothetical protein
LKALLFLIIYNIIIVENLSTDAQKRVSMIQFAETIISKVKSRFEETNDKGANAIVRVKEFMKSVEQDSKDQLQDFKQELEIAKLELQERTEYLKGSKTPKSELMKAELNRNRELKEIQMEIDATLDNIEDDMVKAAIDNNRSAWRVGFAKRLAIQRKNVDSKTYGQFATRIEQVLNDYNEVVSPNYLETDAIIVSLKATIEELITQIKQAEEFTVNE